MGSALDVEIHVHDFPDGPRVVCDVGVTMDGVLDDGAGHGEVYHFHGLILAHHGIDQTGGKGIAAAYTVEDVEGKELAFKGMSLVPHESFQGVGRTGVGIAHMTADALDIGIPLNEMLENLILLLIAGLQGDTVLPVALAGDCDVPWETSSKVKIFEY